jgi:aryl-alcohol dehydrogenase-like predicted oxidoreductase
LDLALGTVQFGLAYGVANDKGKTPNRETRSILELAYECGIRRLDTAAAYGDIEERLAGLCGNLDFSIISKIPAIGSQLPMAEARALVAHSIELSRRRLGDRLVGILFHDAADLRHERGRVLWNSAAEYTARFGLALGSSCYDPQRLAEMAELPGFSLGQLPGNALDQRAAECSLDGIEITFRSAMLQGLLLLPAVEAAVRVPASLEAMARWDKWCRINGLSRLAAAFSVVKGFGHGHFCVIGVDNIGQLEANVTAWESASPIFAPDLAVQDPNCIDPRCWPQRT